MKIHVAGKTTDPHNCFWQRFLGTWYQCVVCGELRKFVAR